MPEVVKEAQRIKIINKRVTKQKVSKQIKPIVTESQGESSIAPEEEEVKQDVCTDGSKQQKTAPDEAKKEKEEKSKEKDQSG